MTTMIDALLHLVTEQVKKTMEAKNTVRLLSAFDYEQTQGYRSRLHHDGQEPSGIVRSLVSKQPRAEHCECIKTAACDKPHEAGKYCELDEQNGHTTADCTELKKVSVNSQKKKALSKGQAQPREDLHKEECSTEVIATIARGHAEGISHTKWEAQLCSRIPTMVFDGRGVMPLPPLVMIP
ncbi:hypothetical protein Cgig2_029447 [Carnegiea gigantea]|uniref:Uncharacterized protein n=1 Tax=Carnegiea gigantea TaxID=171969 RepID=A0A9Q1JKD6_9CARY|nr:hypothetical protein Cgig2_029447 [Carnegiea gigantea]